MKLMVVLSERAKLALAERVHLLREAAEVVDVVTLRATPEANIFPADTLPYLLDINKITVGVALALARAGRKWVVDTGDDPASLAQGRHGSGPLPLAYELVERLMLRRALGVVCRGSFHQVVLRSKSDRPLWWAPDTVPDSILDRPLNHSSQETVVATFGSSGRPVGDRSYGWEVVDIVAESAGTLNGIVVSDAKGVRLLQARAKRLGVADRIDFYGWRPLENLVSALEPSAFITSVQSDNLAGWVRTTGKLPLALGLGKAVVTTRVGEASRILPEGFLVTAPTDALLVEGMLSAILSGRPTNWGEKAKELAEEFRRSKVAKDLSGFLNKLSASG